MTSEAGIGGRPRENGSTMTKDNNPLYHALQITDVLKALDARTEGLTSDEAARRLAAHGPNRLPEAPRRSAFLRFLLHFHNILIYVLIGSAIITAALGHLVDTGVILAVVIANAIIGFVQEGRAENAMDAIRGMLAPRSAVVARWRSPQHRRVDLVPGDVVAAGSRRQGAGGPAPDRGARPARSRKRF